MKTVDNLPGSLRTLRRARTLLLLSTVEPTTNHHICKLGDLSLSSVRKLMRDYIDDDLVFENYHLYRLTSKGRRCLQKVRADPYLVQFMEEELRNKELSLTLQRPNVERL